MNHRCYEFSNFILLMQVYLAVISHPFINQRMKNLTTVIEINSLIFMENFNYAPHYVQILLKKLLFKKRLIIILFKILITVKSNQYFIVFDKQKLEKKDTPKYSAIKN